jgi:hypothetical protein
MLLKVPLFPAKTENPEADSETFPDPLISVL